MKIAVISLGCNKNLVDSEMLLGLLIKNGHEITSDETTADVIIINTCAFIKDAKKESIDKIIEMGELKSTNLKNLIVTGCLANRYEEDIKKSLPEVDFIYKINDFDSIIKFLNNSSSYNHINYNNRILSTPPYSAYVKIADGCNNRCSYCIIPHIRGNYISRTMEDIKSEVVALAENGVTEIILVAQDTTYYGRDIYGKESLSTLLSTLSEIDGIRWIRFLYAYPEGITDELIDTVKKHDKICKYFDIPIQHINNKILKDMNRHTSKENITNLIEKIHTQIPNATLRTSLIVGFPGESEEEFAELKNFVSVANFNCLGVFTYSKEEGTPAYSMKNQVPSKIKNLRRNEIMEIQQKISLKQNESFIGKTFTALVTAKLSDNVYISRLSKDAPEIDGYTFIETDLEIPLGSYVTVYITHAKEYDLIAVLKEN